jgi:hypothetical protein
MWDQEQVYSAIRDVIRGAWEICPTICEFVPHCLAAPELQIQVSDEAPFGSGNAGLLHPPAIG